MIADDDGKVEPVVTRVCRWVLTKSHRSDLVDSSSLFNQRQR
jgi:hypothetical protein